MEIKSSGHNSGEGAAECYRTVRSIRGCAPAPARASRSE